MVWLRPREPSFLELKKPYVEGDTRFGDRRERRRVTVRDLMGTGQQGGEREGGGGGSDGLELHNVDGGGGGRGEVVGGGGTGGGGGGTSSGTTKSSFQGPTSR